jgi:hypothetical protein
MSLALVRPLGAGVVLALLLTGCGDDTPTSNASGDTTTPPAGAAVRGAMPGAFGEIAAADGDVIQVQNQMTGQVAVTVTDATTITAQAAAALVDVTTGACVVVRGADAGGDAVTATSVAVSPAGEDGCTGGFGGGPRGGSDGPGGGNGQRPTGMPSGMPTDMPTARSSGMPGGFGTAGQVTSVSDTGFVIDGPDGSVTVTVAVDTSYTKQVASRASALTVGRCVRVQGDADDTGAVTATSVQVSDKVDDQCGL